jgi:hypothetical protein
MRGIASWKIGNEDIRSLQGALNIRFGPYIAKRKTGTSY